MAGRRINLSFRRRNPMTRDIERFYTDLHSAMYALGDVDDAGFPTAVEFREHLASSPDLVAGRRVLDAGCGATAINTRTALGHGARTVIGLDLNASSLEVASSSLGDDHRPEVAFVRGSLTDLPFPDAAFDLVVCSGVVHHTPDPGRSIRELGRVADPGGHLYISAYCFAGSWASVVVRCWRFLSWGLPFRLVHLLARRSTILNNFVMDHMYVPLLWVYDDAGFTSLLEEQGLMVLSSTRSHADRYGDKRLLGLPLSGDGLLRVFTCRAASDADA